MNLIITILVDIDRANNDEPRISRNDVNSIKLLCVWTYIEFLNIIGFNFKIILKQ